MKWTNKITSVLRQNSKELIAALYSASGTVGRRRRRDGLVILMLHKVSEKHDPLGITLSPDLFSNVLKEISTCHHFVRLDDVAAGMPTGKGEGLGFAVTFDDGYLDNYENALPILRHYGVPASVYVSPDYIDGKRGFWFERLIWMLYATRIERLDLGEINAGVVMLGDTQERRSALAVMNSRLKLLDASSRTRFLDHCMAILNVEEKTDYSPMMTWSMLKEMSAEGMEIGSHTMTHPILSHESDDTVRYELRESRQRIEHKLGRPAGGFAYPNGREEDFSQYIVEEVERTGYQYAVTTVPGINTLPIDRYRLMRVNVHNGMCSKRDGTFNPKLFWAKVLNLL